MKKPSPFFALLTALALTSLVFSGCAGGGSSSIGDSGASNATPEPPSSPSLEFKLNDDGESYAVKSIGTYEALNVVIPETYNSKPVTAIGAKAFSGCEEITSVNIPASVTSIASNAFYGCKKLTNVNVPSSVTSISTYAFKNCDALEYNEYDNAFYLGTDGNPYLALIKAKDLTIETCEINASAKLIAGNAFEKCAELTNVTIPNSVEFIGGYAFSMCAKLSGIVIPEGVTSIGEGVFQGNPAITSVSIPNTLSYIGTNAFKECDALEYNEYDNALYLGNDDNPYVILIKAKNDQITSCDVNASTKLLYHNAFEKCFELQNPVIPNGVVFIGDYVYQSTHVIKSITFPESVTHIGGYVLYNSWALKTVTILSDKAEIGFYSISECPSLKTVYFKGTEEQWNKLTKNNKGKSLETATKYFYSETKPAEEGNFWHFDESGNALAW